MTYTYDLTSQVGQVRFLIQDHDVSSIADTTPLEQRSAAFADEELAFILTQQTDLMRAAALALRVWANNKQLIVVARRNSKASLDYGSIRRDLMEAAKGYEDMADSRPADAIVDMNWDFFSERRIIWNYWLRTSL